MGMDKSLKIRSKLIRARNVYSRYERVAALRGEGIWKEGDSVFGLPKLKILHLKRKKKEKKETEETKTGTKVEAKVEVKTTGAAEAKGKK